MSGEYIFKSIYGLEGRMMDNVELFVRTGTYPSEVKTKSERYSIRRASKKVIYKDKCLFKSYKGRLLKVVRSYGELQEILTRYHEDNDHAGIGKMRAQIMSLYYWGNVTVAVKDWVKKCPQCRHRILGPKTAGTQILQCLAYGCESSSWNNPNRVTFHKFPKDPEIREKWLSVAQRDRGSLRYLSCLCSNHFDPSCFQVGEEGQVILKPEAVPTIMTVQREVQLPIPADEVSLQISTLEELIAASGAAETVETSETSEAALERPDLRGELPEHQYSLPPPDDNNNNDNNNNRTGIQGVMRTCAAEPCFVMYDNIERYLKHRVLPPYTKVHKNSVRRASKRFAVIDGVLMYTQVNPPLKVPRSREEVNEILCHFHDNQGHRGQGMCQQAIGKQFYWATVSKDLARWISTCNTCVNSTKKRRYRCSVYNCTNCCGPVERGLGMTFHKFPIENLALLSRWLRNVGRPNWQPPLWSSVCSAHFTEDCFDHSGNEVRLRPDAVPSLFVYSNPWDQVRINSAQPAPLEAVTTQDQMFFAKYDAVERYLRRGTYPAPGLNSVEKNTFRRFAKKYIIKDDEMHMVRGGRVRRVLRSREDVEMALVSYHDDLNHLDVKKCLRLLNERYFWKTMKPDVVRWIDNCSECSGTKKRTILKNQMELQFSGVLEPNEGLLEAMVGSPQLPQDSYTISEYGGDDDDDDEETCSNDEEHLPECSLSDRKCQPKPDSQSPAQKEVSKSQTEPEPQPRLQTKFAPRTQGLKTAQPHFHTPNQMSTSRRRTTFEQNSGTQLHSHPGIRNQPAKLKTTNAEQPCFETQTEAQTQTSSQARAKRRIQDLVSESPAKRRPSQRVDPLVPQGSQTWPTPSVSESIRATNVKSYSSKCPTVPPVRPSKLQARVVVQHCSQARLKVRPAMDGAEAQWVEIQEGMVVYVCFFQGATTDVVQKMADTVMNAKLFRNAFRLPVSVLELPGSVLLVPQDSLLGDQLVLRRKRIQYQGGCPPWASAQLYTTLVSECRTAMAKYSAKCMRPSPLRGTVEHGTYGQKQDIILSSPEPLTHLLEF